MVQKLVVQGFILQGQAKWGVQCNKKNVQLAMRKNEKVFKENSGIHSLYFIIISLQS